MFDNQFSTLETPREEQILNGRIVDGVLTITIGMNVVIAFLKKKGASLDRVSGSLGEDTLVNALLGGRYYDDEGYRLMGEGEETNSPWEQAIVDACGLAHDDQDAFEYRQRKDREETEF